ncbi:MAG: CinA family nicotinamide mononucleotide deamidase-related protein [Desulfobacteraceae bacterium]|nr:MAG: CinA family nicotinamide mononucleotide deamidase-related protein [Desulfobacteraceae bacterium]
MNGEILSTGDEVCSGAINDTNAAHIASGLKDIGVRVTRHGCVGDDMKDLVAVLSEIGERSDIAIVTGGLGPTVDDLTAEAAAKAGGIGCALDESALTNIRHFFDKFSRKMAPSDIKQAMLPVGAIPIYNPAGTAPGFIQTIGRCRCYFLPGVPGEMEKMFAASVLPDIASLLRKGRVVTCQRQLSVFGLPEARVNDRLAGFSERFPSIKLGMLARFPVITVKLTGFCPLNSREDSMECDIQKAAVQNEIDRAGDWAAERLGDHVFDRDGRSMEAVVGDLLVKQSATLAVAESCTGGLVSHLLTNVAGSSGYFLFSGVTYANQAKMDVLGVSKETLDTVGAVHEETVVQMAEGVRRLSGADWGLATSGIAGPSGGTSDKPVGTVCIGVASEKGSRAFRFYSPFNERLLNKQIFAIWALDTLRKMLIKEMII